MSIRNWAYVITLGMLWGSSFLFVEVLLQTFNPFMVVFCRIALASMVLLMLCAFKKTVLSLSATDIGNLIVMSLLNNVLPFSLMASGQATISGGLAAILNASTSFFSIMLSAVIAEEKLTWNRLVGVTIGMWGVSYAIGHHNLAEMNASGMGKYLVLMAAILYACSGIWAKKRLHNLSPLASTTGMLTISTVVMLPLLWATGTTQFALFTPHLLMIAAVFSLICSVGAFLLYFHILERTGAGNLLICTIIIPPSAIVLNMLFMQEKIERDGMIGLIIITVGLLILDGRPVKFLMRVLSERQQ